MEDELGLDKLIESQAGDYIDSIDKFVEELKDDKGGLDYHVDYENIYTDNIGYVAEIGLNGRKVAVVDAMDGSPMIRSINRHTIDKVLRGLMKEQESETEKMMDKEGMSELEVDKGLNTLSIVDESAGDVKVTISFDLIESIRSDAEKSDGDVFTVTRE